MSTALRTRTDHVWILTSALTIVSGWLAITRNGAHVASSVPETVTVLAIATVKARFIIRDFMEVRAAPSWLRRLTETWLAGLSAIILTMYLL